LYCLGQLNGTTELQQLCEDKLSGSILLAIANLPRYKNTHTKREGLKMVHTKTFHPNLLPGLSFISFVNPYNYNRLTTVALPVKHWPNAKLRIKPRFPENHICHFPHENMWFFEIP
jgi:hypothetical protein